MGDGKGEVEVRGLERIEREARPIEMVDTPVKGLGVKEQGGNEGVNENTVTKILGSGDEGLWVLREIDQNIILPKGKPQGKSNKGGTWKRRVTVMDTTSQSGQGGDIEGVTNCSVKNGKRNFCLVDEEETEYESSQIGKRSKAGVEYQLSCEDMVGVASHEWPQLDQ